MLEDVRPAVYRVHEQCGQIGGGPSTGIVVRTAVEPASITSAVRQAIWSLDRNQPVARIQTMQQIVLSYAVTQRTNEIGVRMALGATSSGILLSFGKRGLSFTLTGLTLGLVLAAIAARSMTTLLYGFRPDYVPTVTVVSLILLAVAAVASFVPARRASRVDPVVALRNE